MERLLGQLTGTVVEIGCGPGRVTEELARRHPQLCVVGVDSSVDMLQWAPAGPVTYMLGDGETLPLDGPVDAIYSHLVFQHLPPARVQGYLREMCRVLRPRGRWLVQFVRGNEHHAMDHRYPVRVMADWAHEAGLQVQIVESHVYPEWVWMKGDRL